MFKKLFYLTAILILSGCDGGNIDTVKKQKLIDSIDYTVGDILDNRGVCSNVEWTENKEKKIVEYNCTLNKGKIFFSFDEAYAKNLREKNLEVGLNNAQVKTQNVIENEKNNIERLENEIANLNKLKSSNEKIFTLENNDDFNLYTYYAFRNWNDSNESLGIKKTIEGEFYSFNMNRSASEYTEIYDYLTDNYNKEDERYNKYKSVVDGDEYNNKGYFQSCVNKEYYDALETEVNNLLNSQSWLDGINNKHYSEIRKICENHLEGIVNNSEKEKKAWIEQCIDNAYKPEYKNLAKEEAISKYKNINFDEKCTLEKENKIKSILETLELYNNQVKAELTKIVEQNLVEKNSELTKSKENIAHYTSSKRLDEEKEEAKTFAEYTVRQYVLTHIPRGVEQIIWEYNSVTKKFIIKSQHLIQYDYDGKVMTGNLYLDVAVYAALNNINDIDNYMKIRQEKALNKLMNYLR